MAGGRGRAEGTREKMEDFNLFQNLPLKLENFEHESCRDF
jgi:hypothetical protein